MAMGEADSVRADTTRSVGDARIWITAALIAALCAVFWLDSRYPSLQGKASADPEESLATPLGFEKHFPEPGAHEPVKHLFWSAAEWAVTNKQGMAFGLLLAAGLMTLVPLLPNVRRGRFAGTVQGALIGAPLGVCVNCAAPIGQAMLRAGSRVEVALATMFASPSFNVIVLGIVLSLFPFYLAAIKIVSSALMVLVVVPWLSGLAERPGWRRATSPAPAQLPGLRLFQWMESAFGGAEASLLRPEDRQPRGLAAAAAWVLLRYPRNLWTVLRLALPLMLLAGLIGAAMAELLPWGRLARMAQVDGLLANAATLLAIAAFGVLLPVPIAFDVIVCAVLWDAGVAPHFVAALLVTLGIYSVYPWNLIGTTLSWRVASAAGGAVLVLGLLSGAAAAVLNNWHELRLARDVAALLDALPPATDAAPAMPAGQPAARLREVAPRVEPAQRLPSADGLDVWRSPFRPTAATGRGFKRLDGATLGFDRLPLPRLYRVMDPAVMHLGPIASGDVNGDGWPDVAIGTSGGVLLYVNVGGRFVQQSIGFDAMRAWTISETALVDLDGDAAPDLFFCAWMQGCHILFNRDGDFPANTHLEMPGGTETSVQAAAFADVDRDGDVDIVTGGASYVPRFFYPATSVNRLWRNQGEQGFVPEPLAGPEGETLTLLFTDLNRDGWPDLYVGNDFDEPDRIYLNERGTLRAVTKAASPIARTTSSTMSVDSGDLDNDGIDELYIGGISMGSPGGSFAARVAQPLPSCEVYRDIADRARCDTIAQFQLAVFMGYGVQSMQPCRTLGDPSPQRDCVVSAYHWNRVLARLPVLAADKGVVLDECMKIPQDFTTLRDVCRAIHDSPMDHEKSDEIHGEELPQVKQTNLLYRGREGAFENVTNAWKAGLGGWTWSARFADFDNDTWQDLYITQGTRLRPSSPSAVLYRNRGGKGFEDVARALGLEEHNPTGGAVFVDYDRDGDLDLITYPFFLSPVVWRNDVAVASAIEVALDDRGSDNRAAVGARVVLHAADGRRQVREIKASGGYQSHDLPVAHFGLGDWGEATALEILWLDGEISRLAAPLREGRYTLVRHPGSKR